MSSPAHGRHLHRHAPPPIPIPRLYPSYSTPSSPFPFPFSPSAASTPSKRRHHPISAPSSTSFPSILLLLLSLRSLYSLLPFLRSTPSSFSLFPFSFLVSLLSLLLSILFPPFSLPSLRILTPSSPHLRPLVAKSSLLTLSLLLRFHALRYCGAAATILADFSGSLVAQSLSTPRRHSARRACGLASLLISLCLLSYSWDRIGCFPLSPSSPPPEGCVRLWPMLLPFLSGFLGFFERAASGWVSLRQLGRRRVRLLSLSLTTFMLFIPASVSFFLAERDYAADVSFMVLGWPLINTVIFGVILSEDFGNEKAVPSAKDLHREFLVMFFCTLVLEMFYFPKLSLPGFFFCGLLMWISVRELVSSSPNYVELGSSDPSASLYSMIMDPLRHILSERKSRKIALFLLINTAYMVVEFVVGFMSNSLGLISDACHMLFDCAALAIGLYASYISRLSANGQFNYGRGRFEVLSGYVNAVLLVLVGALIVLESFERILDPQEISTNSLFTVSIGGLVVNVVGLIFFHEEHHHAHGGGGTCSHSHSHHHHHPHQHHHHEHQHHDHADKKVGRDQKLNSEQHHFVVVSHESSAGHSHAIRNHDCCNHGDINDSQNEKNCSDLGEIRDHRDHHCHGHEHDRHDCHHHHPDVHTHEDSCGPNHDYQEHDISLGSSRSHCYEDHVHDECQGGKENFSPQEPQDLSQMPDHAHNHFSHSKEPFSEGNSLKGSRKHHMDHNMEGIFLHVLADTMGSIGVVISTLLIKYKGWLVADPACSIFISVMIISSVIPLLRNSAEILLQRVPRAHEQDLKAALDDLVRIEGVHGVQNLHTWNLTNTDIVGTLHLHVLADTDKTSAKRRALGLLDEAGIRDVTIQVECMKG